MFQATGCSVRLPSVRPVTAALAALTAAGAALALAFTNPSPSDYQDHAGEQLVAPVQGVVHVGGLPMVLQLWICDCPSWWRPAAGAGSTGRTLHHPGQLGVASVYTTRVGGQQLLPGFTLPTAEVVTLGLPAVSC